MKWYRILILVIILLVVSFGQLNAAKLIWRSCLIGSATCLDALDGGDLTAGDGAFIYFNNSGTYEIYFYLLVDYVSDPPTESSPMYITPNTNAGNKRWVLLQLNASTITFARTNNPGCATLYEATADGNDYAALCAPAVGTGYPTGTATSALLPPINGYLSGYCTVSWVSASGTRVLTTAESHCSYITISGSGGAGIQLEVATPIPGKTYTIYNGSGQNLVVKSSGGSVSNTVGNGHHAFFTSNVTDVIEIWEQTP